MIDRLVKVCVILLWSSCAIALSVYHREGEVRSRFAVVRPLYRGNLATAAGHPLFRHAPCMAHSQSVPVDLVLYYSGQDDELQPCGQNAGEVLRDWAQKLSGLGSCFTSVRVEYAGVIEDYGYPRGPCEQFTGMFSRSPSPLWGYEAIYQMELDVEPVREGWLKEILPVLEKAASGEAWVFGGTLNLECIEDDDLEFNGDAALIRAHINGNAVWSSAAGLRDLILAGDPPLCESPDSYDLELFRRAVVGVGVAGGAELSTSAHASSMFVKDERFENCKADGAEPMDEGDFRGSYPSAVLRHVR